MRESNFVLDRKDDLIKAISRLSERADVYQRKLNTHLKLKDFSIANKKHELQKAS